MKASFYVKEKGEDLQEGSLKGFDSLHECGHRIRDAETREGATLVRVEEAGLSRKGGELDCEDTFEDLQYGLEQDDYSEGCRCVVRWLAGFVKDNPIAVFEGGGVVPEDD